MEALPCHLEGVNLVKVCYSVSMETKEIREDCVSRKLLLEIITSWK